MTAVTRVVDIERPEGAGPPGARSAPPVMGRVLGSGLVPAGVVVVVAVAVLVGFDVSPKDLVAFGGYVALGFALPGMLLWRAARGRAGWLAEDLAAGTVVGYALQVLLYVPARAVGVPLLVLAAPVLTVAVFALVPRLRRFWRGGGRGVRPPVWVAWSLALVLLFLVAWSGLFFRGHGPVWPANASPYFDMPFHLALAGELKHHSPPVIPFVAGEPLQYHWFVYADLAATSWVTGVELETLLYRLWVLPVIAALVVLVAVAAVRLTGRWWTAPAALAVTYFSMAPSPYNWGGTIFDASSLGQLWLSPTHIFGMTLFAAVVLLLFHLYGRTGDPADAMADGPGTPARPPGRVFAWCLFAVLIAAVMGSKATFLPMLLAGLLLAVAGGFLVRRRLDRTALLAAAITAAGLAFAQLVLFGGSDGAAQLLPFKTASYFSLTTPTGLDKRPVVSTEVLAALAALGVIGWAMIWAGAGGLIARLRGLAEPAVLVLVGIAGSAFGAVLVFSFPGAAQLYFLRGAGPTLALLTVAGLAAVVPLGRRPGPLLVAALVALAVGALITVVVAGLGRSSAPTVAGEGRARWVLVSLALPWVALVAAVVGFGLLVWLARRRWAFLRGIGLALTLLVAMGLGLPQTWERIHKSFRAVATDWRPAQMADGLPEIGRDDIAAARWLRDHSDPDDLVATNAHCRPSIAWGCDNRHFWVSAYAERRVLVEGWGYTVTANETSVRTRTWFALVPYWRSPVLQANDAAFTAPSPAALRRLHTEYGVRWLLADSRAQRVSPELGRYARLRFQVEDCAVYEIVD
jgi:hypothetical protein